MRTSTPQNAAVAYAFYLNVSAYLMASRVLLVVSAVVVLAQALYVQQSSLLNNADDTALVIDIIDKTPQAPHPK